jgi:WD40 repeat protein
MIYFQRNILLLICLMLVLLLQKHNAVEILDIGISSNGKFIITGFRDTTILIWDLKGVFM